MHIKEALSFDDVLLEPQYSDIRSRSEVDLSVKLSKGFKFSNPIVPANMKTITAYDMAEQIYLARGLAIIHRFQSIEDQLDTFDTLNRHNSDKVFDYVGASVGVKGEDRIYVDRFVDHGVKILCVDIAHGHSLVAEEMCDYISSKYPKVLLIAGNVATDQGAILLWEAGADVVKVGVGGGSLCTTRIETGNGVPTLSSIVEVAEARTMQVATSRTKKSIFLMADGGIRNAGDCVKSLCFADMVMAGNIFAGSTETPGNTITLNGVQYKEYVGSSTHKANRVEGVSALVNQKGPAREILEKLLEGIQSGCSYQGCRNLTELKESPTFVRISGAGLKESHPHDVQIIK